MENPIKIHDLGGFPTIFGNTHISYTNYGEVGKSRKPSRILTEGRMKPFLLWWGAKIWCNHLNVDVSPKSISRFLHVALASCTVTICVLLCVIEPNINKHIRFKVLSVLSCTICIIYVSCILPSEMLGKPANILWFSKRLPLQPSGMYPSGYDLEVPPDQPTCDGIAHQLLVWFWRLRTREDTEANTLLDSPPWSDHHFMEWPEFLGHFCSYKFRQKNNTTKREPWFLPGSPPENNHHHFTGGIAVWHKGFHSFYVPRRLFWRFFHPNGKSMSFFRQLSELKRQNTKPLSCQNTHSETNIPPVSPQSFKPSWKVQC